MHQFEQFVRYPIHFHPYIFVLKILLFTSAVYVQMYVRLDSINEADTMIPKGAD